MDRALNPFSPGAGTPPPELAGRAEIIAEADVALRRCKLGRHARGLLLLGLRGVGKTVLLNRIGELAEERGFVRVQLEAPENKRLAGILVPVLRGHLIKLSASDQARHLARRALAVLRAFAGAFKVAIGDIEISMTDAERGLADSGDLELDLPELLAAVAAAAKSADRGLAILIDEVQYLAEEDFAALIVASHKLAQSGAPFIVFGAGLPQIAALAGEAKSYAERLFLFPDIGALDPASARDAIRVPLRSQRVEIAEDALAAIVEQTRGYPYYLQEWGAHAWNAAARSPIRLADVAAAAELAVKDLDHNFFRVRFDRLTPREKDYVRAMAELGPGPHRSGAIAQLLQIRVESAGPLRDALIKKGMVYSPQHGETAFTVPMFDGFVKRIMPGWEASGKPEGKRPEKPARKRPR
jgi:hypothetical protein